MNNFFEIYIFVLCFSEEVVSVYASVYARSIFWICGGGVLNENKKFQNNINNDYYSFEYKNVIKISQYYGIYRTKDS